MSLPTKSADCAWCSEQRSAIYADGGVIYGLTPETRVASSPIGGVFWTRLVVDDQLVVSRGGIVLTPAYFGRIGGVLSEQAAKDYSVLPCNIPSVGNNVMELTALDAALRLVSAGWSGRVCSDSKNALGFAFAHADPKRVTIHTPLRASEYPWRPKVLPIGLVTQLRLHAERVNKAHIVLHDGHPTKEHLERGFGKRGNTVSMEQHRCDLECNRIKAFVVTALRALEPALAGTV